MMTVEPRRSVSAGNLSERSPGGIKGWWERFSGRFKRLTKISSQAGLEGRSRLMSQNELHYEHLLPHSPVFTLGFTGLEPHHSPPQVLDLPPHFSHAAKVNNQSNINGNQ